jgi:hypothetical protein
VDTLALAGEELEGLPEPGHGLGRNGLTLEHALCEVAVHDHRAGTLQSGAGGPQLNEDIRTIAVFFEHFAKRADLPLDARKAVKKAIFGPDLVGASH